MEIAAIDDMEFACNAIFDRIQHPPRGRDGGHDGAAGYVGLTSGSLLRAKGFQIIPDGERLLLKLPGGGGMGPPSERDPEAVARDVRDGVVSVAAAREIYRVAVDADGAIEGEETRVLRDGNRRE